MVLRSPAAIELHAVGEDARRGEWPKMASRPNDTTDSWRRNVGVEVITRHRMDASCPITARFATMLSAILPRRVFKPRNALIDPSVHGNRYATQLNAAHKMYHFSAKTIRFAMRNNKGIGRE